MGEGLGYHETLPKPRPTGSVAVRGVRRGAGENPMRPSRPRKWGGTVRGVTSRGAVGGASADRAAWGRARLVAVAAGSIHEEALISCHLFYFSRHDTTLGQQGRGLPTLRGGCRLYEGAALRVGHGRGGTGSRLPSRDDGIR